MLKPKIIVGAVAAAMLSSAVLAQGNVAPAVGAAGSTADDIALALILAMEASTLGYVISDNNDNGGSSNPGASTD